MAKKNTRKKAAYRKNLQNRFSMGLVTVVVVVLVHSLLIDGILQELIMGFLQVQEEKTVKKNVVT